MRSKTCLTLFIIFFAFYTKAQNKSNSFSLQQAIEFALKNSPSYLNTEEDLKSSVYKKNEMIGAGLPQINGSFDFKDYFNIPQSVMDIHKLNPMAPVGTYTNLAFGLKYNATAGFNASQLIFSADYLFGIKASKEFVNLSRINVTRSKSDLIAQVSKAYYGVLINNERFGLLEANLVKLEKTLNELKATNTQGFVEQIDVDRLQVATNNLKIEKEKVENLIDLSKNLLKFQIGYKINDEINLTDSLHFDQTEQDIKLEPVDAKKRPDYQLLEAQQKLNEIDVKRLKWGYLPTISAYGSYQYNTYRPEANIFENDNANAAKKWFKIALIGATLNWNLFDGMQRHNKIQQAKIAYKKNINTFNALQLAADLEASTARITYNNALKTLNSNKQNVELARKVYEVAQKKYNQGIGSNLEIINAQTTLKEAETNYYSSLYDAIISKTDYQKATGNLIK
ncbi:MAG: TolC family protein [Bacteroidetes bacterium]|nr:TolC family protein [Bacteroidota bacterium]